MNKLKKFFSIPDVQVIFIMIGMVIVFLLVYEPIKEVSGSKKIERSWHKQVDTLYFNVRDYFFE